MKPRSTTTIGVALAIALAGCFGGEATAPPATSTPEPVATPVVSRYRLEVTAWEQGFVLTFHQATATLDAKGGPVTITVTVANPGTDDASLDAPIRLTASGAAFDLVHGTVLPVVVAGGSADVTLEFDVEGRSNIDDGVIRVGRTADHIVQVPFLPGPVDALTLEPRSANAKATVTAGGIRIVLRNVGIRWDLPDWYDELPVSSEAVTLTYDVTYIGTFSGGFAFTAANIGLRLPNGTIVAPRRDGHSQSTALLGPGKTVPSLFSRFEIPSGLTGTFALVARDGSTQQAVKFTIAP